jgi:LPS sulfotransferase NodH
VICSGPRAGSHFYASILAAAGIAGRPDDHFNPCGGGRRERRGADTLPYNRQYVDEVIAETTTANGVFGTMTQFNQIANFVGFQRLESLFPAPIKYVHLERKDKLRQAVSLAIARQTGQFQRGEPTAREAIYNPEQIRCCLEEVMNHNRGWEMYFWERGVQPLHVLYEDLVLSTLDTIKRTLSYLEIDVPRDFVLPESHLKKQATEVNDEWVLKYKSSTLYR